MTLEKEMQQYEEKWYAAEDTAEDAAEEATRSRDKYHEIAAAIFYSMFDLSKDAVHATNTTNTNIIIKTPILTTTTGNNYYDNIDNEILRIEYEGTIVFEDDSSALTTVCMDNPNDIIFKVFELFNEFNKHQQQQLDTTTANIPPIAVPSTNTILLNTKKTHPQPKDRQVPVIWKNNTNKKKKKQKKVTQPKTRTPQKRKRPTR